MTKWQYTEIRVGHPNMSTGMFNGLGEQGWELVQLVPCGSGPTGDHIAIFKRPVEEFKDPQTG